MSYEVQIIADSIGPNDKRLATFQLRFPRFILAQFNTHRAISKNARSSRAVPTAKLIEEIQNDPVMPISWGANGKGMQAHRELSKAAQYEAQSRWIIARNDALHHANMLAKAGVHKQIVNRLLEPFMWVDVVASATDWANFFALRCHDDAQPEMTVLAVKMARAYRDGEPTPLKAGWWHLPYVTAEELAVSNEMRWKGYHTQELLEEETRLLKLSVARCARVSYRTFDGARPDPTKDIELHDRLSQSGHWSPFEHQGRAAMYGVERSGNFFGWTQYRQTLPKSVHREFDFAKLDEFENRDFIV